MGKGDCHSGNLLICSQNSSYRSYSEAFEEGGVADLKMSDCGINGNFLFLSILRRKNQIHI